MVPPVRCSLSLVALATTMTVGMALLLTVCMMGSFAGATVATVATETTRTNERLLSAASQLLSVAPPPRMCGTVIQTATKDQVIAFLTGYTQVLLLSFNNPGLTNVAVALVTGPIKYGIQARVVCSSCQRIREIYPDASFVSNTTAPNGFPSFCGPDRYASNTTFSGLVLLPIDEATNKTVAGKIKVCRVCMFVCGCIYANPHGCYRFGVVIQKLH